MAQGVVFHVNEAAPEKHRMAVRNLENAKKGLPEQPMEIVINGPGLSMAAAGTSTVVEEIAALQKQGVIVAVCRQTMKQHNMEEQDLLPGMLVVPSGVVRLIERQQDGYSYIKP